MRPIARLAWTLSTVTAFTALSSIASAGSIPYETSGLFDQTGHNTDYNIGYQAAQLFGPTSYGGGYGILQLGQFMVEPLLKFHTFNNDPFTIDVTFHDSPHGGGPTDGTAVMEVKGTLNGTVTGADTSTVVATFTSVSQVSGNVPLPFDLSSVHVLSPISLVASSGYSPGGANFGLTPIYATVMTPEPSAIALWGVAATLGLAATARVRRTPMRG